MHRSLGVHVSFVRSLSLDTLTEREEASLHLGGNPAFASFLADDARGVPRKVWLALPLTTRYFTPAADLYRRRQEAEATGTEELPTELVRQPLPAPAKRQRLAHTPVVAGITGVDMMGSRSCWSWRGLW